MGLRKDVAGASSSKLLILVEKRTRPTWMGNTGVLVPWTIACTAIGMDGVLVAGLVSVAAGDGVITKKVGVSCTCTSARVFVAATGTVSVGETTAGVLDVAVDCGATARVAGRFMKNRTAATMTEKKPPTSDQRARTT